MRECVCVIGREGKRERKRERVRESVYVCVLEREAGGEGYRQVNAGKNMQREVLPQPYCVPVDAYSHLSWEVEG